MKEHMKLELKYDIGDKVFLIFNNKITETSIRLIEISVSENKVQALYKIKENVTGYDLLYKEDEIFATKQELLNTL